MDLKKLIAAAVEGNIADILEIMDVEQVKQVVVQELVSMVVGQTKEAIRSQAANSLIAVDWSAIVGDEIKKVTDEFLSEGKVRTRLEDMVIQELLARRDEVVPIEEIIHDIVTDNEVVTTIVTRAKDTLDKDAEEYARSIADRGLETIKNEYPLLMTNIDALLKFKEEAGKDIGELTNKVHDLEFKVESMRAR